MNSQILDLCQKWLTAEEMAISMNLESERDTIFEIRNEAPSASECVS
jgi:hypothetical protein